MSGMLPKIRTNEDIPNFSAKGSRKRQLGSNGFLKIIKLRKSECETRLTTGRFLFVKP
jgi:hypothetical protein